MCIFAEKPIKGKSFMYGYKTILIDNDGKYRSAWAETPIEGAGWEKAKSYDVHEICRASYSRKLIGKFSAYKSRSDADDLKIRQSYSPQLVARFNRSIVVKVKLRGDIIIGEDINESFVIAGNEMKVLKEVE